MNALLSYAYTLLLNEARTAVEAAGLDPYIGFLHRQWRDRPSAALDLMEEFRPLLVDTVVLWLISVGAVTLKQFSNTDDGGCRMDLPCRRTLIKEFERRMLTTINHPTARRRMSYRAAMGQQAIELAQVVAGKSPSYQPIPWR